MSIKILPPHIVNQISAGEIIERPASVVKELMENSLDAGANRIDININQGGTKLIQIQDNGCGIIKNELCIALQRYATSKIRYAKDLEEIKTLGFRGEALTTISSISRLTLTSQTINQKQAWQIYTEGIQSNIKIKPATHPVGTTIKVFDLFYNTPVRRKLMKTEKIEFNYIDLILNQILLARFDITISLSHNGNLIYYQPSVVTESETKRRLISICGIDFVKNAFYIDYRRDNLFLHGWMSAINICMSHKTLQYCYVNGRIVKNKIITDAIKQAYQSILQNNKKMSYIIYLEIDPNQVNVNIHPSKKEVCFYQSGLIHNFIIQGVTDLLKNIFEKTKINISCVKNHKYQLKINNNHLKSNNFFSLPDWYYEDDILNLKNKQIKTNYDNHISIYKSPILKTYSKIFGQLLTILKNRYAVLKKNQQLLLMSLSTALRYLKQEQLHHNKIKYKTTPLIIPLKMKINEYYLKIILENYELIKKTGILFQIERDTLNLYSVPSTLHKYRLKNLIFEMLEYLNKQKNTSDKQLFYWLLSYSDSNENIDWDILKVNILLAEIEYFCPYLINNMPSDLIQHININNAIDTLNHG
ncbi:DNA mismatch repair endonuclease MutL [Candidatus Pantoea edessiphila]|nr:DNA mismatch repair endonuclease MutL [Candidatus Pantoea edessiphila]